MPTRRAVLATLGSAAAAGCTIGGQPPTPDGFRVQSPAFPDGGDVPTEFTCDGEGRSPPFTLSGIPEPTEAFAIIGTYPNSFAQQFVHWLLWDVPPDRTEIPAGLPAEGTLPELGDARQGTNGAGTVGYIPICPPPTLGEERYWFTVTALRRPLDLPPEANMEQFEEAIEGARLSSIRYTGRYARPEDATGTARGGSPTGTPTDG